MTVAEAKALIAQIEGRWTQLSPSDRQDARATILELERQLLDPADPAWFIERNLKIRDKAGNLIPLRLNAIQRKIVAKVQELRAQGVPPRIIILKARQMGCSTCIEALLFHSTVTNELTYSIITAHDEDSSRNLFRMSELFYKELPREKQPLLRHSNRTELLFENPSRKDYKRDPGLRSHIFVDTAKNVDVARSGTPTNFHGSEVARWPDGKSLMVSLLNAMPQHANTLCVLESTAQSVGDYFWNTWRAAKEQETDFVPLFFAWFEDSTYSRPFASEAQRTRFLDGLTQEDLDYQKTYRLTDEQMHWRAWAIQNLCHGDLELFQQEYPSNDEECFLVSGRSVFDLRAVAARRLHVRPGEAGELEWDGVAVRFHKHSGGYLEIWEHPQSGKDYVIGADVAQGLPHGDYSVAHVLDEQLKHVATWYGHIDPDLFADELVKLAIYYNEAFLGWEVNDSGISVTDAIKRSPYSNVYKRMEYDQFTDEFREELGWQTSQKTRPLLVDGLKAAIRTGDLVSYDARFWDECRTFVRDDKGKPRAEAGCQDDSVMAMGIALQMHKLKPFGMPEPFVAGTAPRKRDDRHPSVVEDEEAQDPWP